MIKKIKFLLIGLFAVLIPIKASALPSPDEQREAVIETAHAYKNRGGYLQYDSFRKNLNATPEDATADHFVYTVCSGFTYSVYKQALGIDIPNSTEALLDYAEKNKSKSDNIIFYYGSNSEITSDEVLGGGSQKFVENWIDEVKSGDIFVYDNKGTGHAVLVEKVEGKTIYLLESNGGRYQIDSHTESFEDSGTIRTPSLTDRLASTYNEMALIRVITDGQHYINTKNEKVTYDGITASAKSRLAYKGIDIEKTVKVSDSSSPIFADIGDEITYKIKIKNNSDSKYSGIEVVEKIDPRLSVVSTGNGYLNDKELKWELDLPAGEEITLSYTVKVPSKESLIGEIIVSSGRVANIATSKTEILIGNRLTEEERQKLVDEFERLFNINNRSTLLERNFINQVYIDALNIDLGLDKLNNLDIISYEQTNTTSGGETLSVKYAKLNDTYLRKYVYSNFYGLRLGSSANVEKNIVNAWSQWNINPTLESNDRARTLTSDMLLDGDIVLVYGKNRDTADADLINKSYLYLNNTLYRKKTESEFEEISGNDLTVFLRNLIGENYIVLRPSLALSNDIETEQDQDIILKDEEHVDIDETTNEQIKNPDTGFDLEYGILIIIILISGIAYLLVRNKSMFKKHN